MLGLDRKPAAVIAVLFILLALAAVAGGLIWSYKQKEKRRSYDEAKLAKVRKICLAYPEAVEVEQFGESWFKAGKKYQVLITRLVGGKEDVYARANLELK